MSAEGLTVAEEDLGSVLVIAITGELDHATAPLVSDALRRATLESDGPVVVDLCDTMFIDSAGISTLLNALRRLTRQRRRMAIVCPPAGPLRRTFELLGLIGTFELFDTRGAALAGVGDVRA